MQSAEDYASSRQQNKEENADYSLPLLRPSRRTAALLSEHFSAPSTDRETAFKPCHTKKWLV